MPLSSAQVQRFVQRALVGAAGAGAPDPARILSSFTFLCERLRKQLQPLFGTAAVTALFARALHVATSDFPWLAEIVRKNGDGCSADAMTGIQGVEIDQLVNGLSTVLANNIGLLSTFVGEDLVLPLVQQAWGTVMLADDQRGPKVIHE
jgi:hypothetical protein